MRIVHAAVSVVCLYSSNTLDTRVRLCIADTKRVVWRVWTLSKPHINCCGVWLLFRPKIWQLQSKFMHVLQVTYHLLWVVHVPANHWLVPRGREQPIQHTRQGNCVYSIVWVSQWLAAHLFWASSTWQDTTRWLWPHSSWRFSPLVESWISPTHRHALLTLMCC